MTSTITAFQAKTAPCGTTQSGETVATEDSAGLETRDVRFACGCHTHHEEFHDGSVHNQVVDHHGRELLDEELRGE